MQRLMRLSALRLSLLGSRGFASNQGFNGVPIIDVSALVEPSTTLESRRRTGQELHIACRDVGFFYIRNAMNLQIASNVREQAKLWFALPEATKREIMLSPETHYRGYQPLGVNVTQGARDWHEGIDLYREYTPEQFSSVPPSPIHSTRNPWPCHIPAFELALKTYINACLELGAALMRGIALGLDIPEDTFAGDAAGDSYWVLRALHYPPLSSFPDKQPQCLKTTPDPRDNVDSAESVSCGAHTDYGLLTIITADPDVTALQIMNSNGRWIEAPPLADTFICNIGDMLRIWTNGLYKPTLHRVVNSNEKSRTSVAFFYEPNFEAKVAPIPALIERSGQPALQGVRYGSHLESKVLNNFELDVPAEGAAAG